MKETRLTRRLKRHISFKMGSLGIHSWVIKANETPTGEGRLFLWGTVEEAEEGGGRLEVLAKF